MAMEHSPFIDDKHDDMIYLLPFINIDATR